MADKEKYGFKFNKLDMDRLGIFSESSYLSGKGFIYIPRHKGHFRTVASGRQMYPGISKTKSGKQDGYFQKEFLRIFEGEAYESKFKREMAERKVRNEKLISTSPFLRPQPSKKHSTPGDFYGTFFKKPPTAMDPRPREKHKRVSVLRNFVTNPGKKGGPGFVDITFSKYPQSIVPGIVKKALTKRDKQEVKHLLPIHPAGKGSRFFTENPYKMDNEPRVPLYIKPVEGKSKMKQINEGKVAQPPQKRQIKSPGIFLPAGPAKKGVFFRKLNYLIPPRVVENLAEKLAAHRAAPPNPVFYPTRGRPFRYVPRRLPQMMPSYPRDYFERDIRRPFVGEAYDYRKDLQHFVGPYEREVLGRRGRPVPPMQVPVATPRRPVPAIDPNVRPPSPQGPVQPFIVGDRRLETFDPQLPHVPPQYEESHVVEREKRVERTRRFYRRAIP